MKKRTRKAVVKELDDTFSLYIRNRDNWTCVTCGASNWHNENKEGPVMQCGHLFSRNAYSTRWDEDNAACQCKGCNMRHEHDAYPLTQYFIELFGQDGVDTLHIQYRNTAKYSTAELEELLVSLKAKLAVAGGA